MQVPDGALGVHDRFEPSRSHSEHAVDARLHVSSMRSEQVVPGILRGCPDHDPTLGERRRPGDTQCTNGGCSTCTAKDKPSTHRSGYRPWRELLMRSFKIDVELCQSCGARMRLRALVMTTSGIERYLSWLGEPIDPPTLAPARDPPFFKSQVIRRRLGEAAQAELFDAH